MLALAALSQADVITSGDADLVILSSHAGIPIIDATKVISPVRG